MTWEDVEQTGLLYANAGGVPHHDANYKGWYYRPWTREAAWEYWRITSTGEFELHQIDFNSLSLPETIDPTLSTLLRFLCSKCKYQ